MGDRKMRAFCYAVLFLLVAVEWTQVGAALFLCLMDFIDS